MQILWRAVVDNSVVPGGVVDVYTGTAQTVMTFTFTRSLTFPYYPSVQLTSAHNLLSNTIEWYVCILLHISNVMMMSYTYNAIFFLLEFISMMVLQ